jgi:hypothetical protein
MKKTMVRRLAGLELNALLHAKKLPDVFKGARIARAGTAIRDLDQEIIFYRVPIRKKRKIIAYADLATNPVFGSPLLAYHQGMEWTPEIFVEKALEAAMKHNRRFSYDSYSFIAYNYPKIAIQFLKERKEVAMIELHSWEPVPPFEEEPKDPYRARWSIVKTMPKELKESRTKKYNETLKNWDGLVPLQVNAELLEPAELQVVWPTITSDERLIHYSTDLSTHFPCFELVGQHTSVWCVAASTKMILDFYRFVYTQDRIADEEDLGTHAVPNGLPYGDEQKVIDTIEKLSSNGLECSLDWSPGWSEFTSEIDANRPVISFIPGHARAIAGYKFVKIFGWYFTRFLRLYDPWYPHIGQISWENFDVQTYRCSFYTKPKLV